MAPLLSRGTSVMSQNGTDRLPDSGSTPIHRSTCFRGGTGRLSHSHQAFSPTSPSTSGQ